MGVADLAHHCFACEQTVEYFYPLLDRSELNKTVTRSGQLRQYNDLLKTMRPAGPFNPRDYFFNASASTTSIIRDPLYEFLQMRVCLFGDRDFLALTNTLEPASWPGCHHSRAAFEGSMALRVPVPVWFIPHRNHFASRRWS
jgi:hypothetical protein